VIINADPEGESPFFEDKQYMTVDASTSSPFRDRVYVTWTEFGPAGAFIYESHSADYGEHFSAKKLVSPNTPTMICPRPGPGGCDSNQFSQPFTSPDGTLYVVWANYNVTVARPNEDDGDRMAAMPATLAARASTPHPWTRTTAPRSCCRSRWTAAPPSARRSR